VTFYEAYQHSVAQIAAVTPTLILGSGTSDEPLSLNRVILTKDVAQEFSDIAKNAVSQPDQIQLLAYSASYKPDQGEVLYISLAQDVKVKAIVDDLVAFQNISLLKGGVSATEDLKFYSLVFGSQKEARVVLLRAISEKIELSKGNRVAALLRDGTFSQLKQKVFLFDRRVDCIAAGGFLFIFNKSGFERLFQYYEQLRANAASTVKEVTKYIQISNIEEFTKACTTQVRFMDKMAAISKRPYLSKITINDIKKVIAVFNLSVPIVADDGVEKIVFETSPDKRWQILKLLDDDYLGSIMTQEKYAANSKMRVSS